MFENTINYAWKRMHNRLLWNLLVTLYMPFIFQEQLKQTKWKITELNFTFWVIILWFQYLLTHYFIVISIALILYEYVYRKNTRTISINIVKVHICVSIPFITKLYFLCVSIGMILKVTLCITWCIISNNFTSVFHDVTRR